MRKQRRRSAVQYQSLCFRDTDSTISLLPKSEISSFWPFSETVQTGLRQTWSETLKTKFTLDLVGNPEDRFSCVGAHIVGSNFYYLSNYCCQLSVNILTIISIANNVLSGSVHVTVATSCEILFLFARKSKAKGDCLGIL